MKLSLCLLLPVVLAPLPLSAQRYHDDDGKIRTALVKMPYRGARNVAELSEVPDYLEAGGIREEITEWGGAPRATETVGLAASEANQYGEWHRLGLANGHLAEIVARNESEGFLSIGLLANCSSLMGMLAGLQASDPLGGARKVGLVFVDAHGDFNTPETTLSGMLGGMPVAVSAGLALQNLRLKSRLDPAIPTEHIVLAAVRDLDPLERELIESSDVEQMTTDDIRERGDGLHSQMRRLSELTDIIYVHIDMDVLDPREVAGHPLTVPDGPTSVELAAALTEMFRYEKVAALGLASTPAGENDPEGISRQAAYRLIQGAIEGIRQR
jgi:arginase